MSFSFGVDESHPDSTLKGISSMKRRCPVFLIFFILCVIPHVIYAFHEDDNVTEAREHEISGIEVEFGDELEATEEPEGAQTSLYEALLQHPDFVSTRFGADRALTHTDMVHHASSLLHHLSLAHSAVVPIDADIFESYVESSDRGVGVLALIVEDEDGSVDVPYRERWDAFAPRRKGSIPVRESEGDGDAHRVCEACLGMDAAFTHTARSYQWQALSAQNAAYDSVAALPPSLVPPALPAAARATWAHPPTRAPTAPLRTITSRVAPPRAHALRSLRHAAHAHFARTSPFPAAFPWSAPAASPMPPIDSCVGPVGSAGARIACRLHPLLGLASCPMEAGPVPDEHDDQLAHALDATTAHPSSSSSPSSPAPSAPLASPQPMPVPLPAGPPSPAALLALAPLPPRARQLVRLFRAAAFASRCGVRVLVALDWARVRWTDAYRAWLFPWAQDTFPTVDSGDARAAHTAHTSLVDWSTYDLAGTPLATCSLTHLLAWDYPVYQHLFGLAGGRLSAPDDAPKAVCAQPSAAPTASRVHDAVDGYAEQLVLWGRLAGPVPGAPGVSIISCAASEARERAVAEQVRSQLAQLPTDAGAAASLRRRLAHLLRARAAMADVRYASTDAWHGCPGSVVRVRRAQGVYAAAAAAVRGYFPYALPPTLTSSLPPLVFARVPISQAPALRSSQLDALPALVYLPPDARAHTQARYLRAVGTVEAVQRRARLSLQGVEHAMHEAARIDLGGLKPVIVADAVAALAKFPDPVERAWPPKHTAAHAATAALFRQYRRGFSSSDGELNWAPHPHTFPAADFPMTVGQQQCAVRIVPRAQPSLTAADLTLCVAPLLREAEALHVGVDAAGPEDGDAYKAAYWRTAAAALARERTLHSIAMRENGGPCATEACPAAAPLGGEWLFRGVEWLLPVVPSYNRILQRLEETRQQEVASSAAAAQSVTREGGHAWLSDDFRRLVSLAGAACVALPAAVRTWGRSCWLALVHSSNGTSTSWQAETAGVALLCLVCILSAGLVRWQRHLFASMARGCGRALASHGLWALLLALAFTFSTSGWKHAQLEGEGALAEDTHPYLLTVESSTLLAALHHSLTVLLRGVIAAQAVTHALVLRVLGASAEATAKEGSFARSLVSLTEAATRWTDPTGLGGSDAAAALALAVEEHVGTMLRNAAVVVASFATQLGVGHLYVSVRMWAEEVVSALAYLSAGAGLFSDEYSQQTFQESLVVCLLLMATAVFAALAERVAAWGTEGGLGVQTNRREDYLSCNCLHAASVPHAVPSVGVDTGAPRPASPTTALGLADGRASALAICALLGSCACACVYLDWFTNKYVGYFHHLQRHRFW